MSGWTGYPVQDLDACVRRGPTAVLARAYNERSAAIGGSEEAVPAQWDALAFSRTWIHRVQDFVDGNATTFIATKELVGGVWTDIPHFSQRTSIDLWTLADLRAAAGLNASGFRREYPARIATNLDATYDDGGTPAAGEKARCMADGKVYQRTGGAWVLMAQPFSREPTKRVAYGHAEQWDYIGPHLFNELRACLDLMLWTRKSGVLDSGWWSNDGIMRNGNDTDPVLATAKANADTDFDSFEYTGFYVPQNWNYYNGPDGGGDYYAELWHAQNYAEFNMVIALAA